MLDEAYIQYTPPMNVDYSIYTNIMFIHSDVEQANFSSYCNDDTYPLVYQSNTSRESIHDFISNFNSINRIAFAFHDPTIIDGNYEQHIFLNMEPLFDINESSIDTTTNNYLFVKGLIQQFSLSNVDFLACNLLNYAEWKTYFESLQSIGNVIIGASDDNTGNLKYGGDWVMENTAENIKTTYFNETIVDYQYLLDAISHDQDAVAWAFAALKSDGSVYGWPSNSYGGSPPSSVTSANSGVVSITSGRSSIGALKSDGTAVIWGGSAGTYTNVVSLHLNYYNHAVLRSDGTISGN